MQLRSLLLTDKKYKSASRSKPFTRGARHTIRSQIAKISTYKCNKEIARSASSTYDCGVDYICVQALKRRPPRPRTRAHVILPRLWRARPRDLKLFATLLSVYTTLNLTASAALQSKLAAPKWSRNSLLRCFQRQKSRWKKLRSARAMRHSPKQLELLPQLPQPQ